MHLIYASEGTELWPPCACGDENCTNGLCIPIEWTYSPEKEEVKAILLAQGLSHLMILTEPDDERTTSYMNTDEEMETIKTYWACNQCLHRMEACGLVAHVYDAL